MVRYHTSQPSTREYDSYRVRSIASLHCLAWNAWTNVNGLHLEAFRVYLGSDLTTK